MNQSRACSSDPSAQRTQTSHPWLSEAGPYRHVRLLLCLPSLSSLISSGDWFAVLLPFNIYLYIPRREDQM